MAERVATVRKRLGRPLTLTEKILLGHLDDPETADLRAGESYLQLRPDRVAMQDATAQMALLQFAQAEIPRVAVPTTVHCDHLIQAREGAEKDTLRGARREPGGLRLPAHRRRTAYGIGFWKPGAGIIHQVVLENYAFPGGMMIGTDSHTPERGRPRDVRVRRGRRRRGGRDGRLPVGGEVTRAHRRASSPGQLSGWASPKDVILVALRHPHGEGRDERRHRVLRPRRRVDLAAPGKGTIANMGAELGATTSIFPFDASMDRYLRGTVRARSSPTSRRSTSDLVTPDPEVERDPSKYFARVVEIDLSTLEPHLVGTAHARPGAPDLRCRGSGRRRSRTRTTSRSR